MSSVYTQRFAHLEGDGDTSTFEVPENHRVVIKSVVASAGKPGEHVLLVFAHGVLVYQWRTPGTEFIGTFQELNVVLYERETLTCTTYGAEMTCSVTGYIFPDAQGPLGEITVRSRPEGKPISEASSSPARS